MWARLLVLIPLQIISAFPECSPSVPAAACNVEEDSTSLLQVSQEVSMPAARHPPNRELAAKAEKLKVQIASTRAHLGQTLTSLAAMEAELSMIESADGGSNAPNSLLQMPDGRSFSAATGGLPLPADSTREAASFLEGEATMSEAVEAAGTGLDAGLGGMNNMAQEGLANWQGMASPQYEASESYVMGQGCKSLPNVLALGGPAALPNILSNKVVLYAKAGYKGHKLRDQVARAFAQELPGSGPWNVAAGKIDWNLYHEGRACTVAVKLPEWGLDWLVYGGH